MPLPPGCSGGHGEVIGYATKRSVLVRVLPRDAEDPEPPYMIVLELEDPSLVFFDNEAAWRRWMHWIDSLDGAPEPPEQPARTTGTSAVRAAEFEARCQVAQFTLEQCGFLYALEQRHAEDSAPDLARMGAIAAGSAAAGK